MEPDALSLHGVCSRILSLCLAGFLASSANAIQSFNSTDQRLPNPDRPYEMTSGTIHYGSSLFSLYDLTFQPAEKLQLASPTLRADGRLEFDSTFNINYIAVISSGLEPSHSVSGIGTARAVGVTRAETGAAGDFAYFRPQVFDTELVALNLFGLSPIPEIMFRESPALSSGGVTIRENVCPVCASATMFWNISSFFDVYTEYSINGGASWNAADRVLHVEQAPDGYPPGDYNQDKKIDDSDYDVWRSTLDFAGAGLAADGSWSGRIDAGDYVVWRANADRLASDGATGSATTPEPTAFAMICLVFTSALLLRRRTY